jgi:small-conductance mechanosensitive channel
VEHAFSPLIDFAALWWPTVAFAILYGAFFHGLKYFLEKTFWAHTGDATLRTIFLVVVAAVGIVLIILTLPINDSMKGQLMSLLGLVVTGTIALSSTTFVGNAMAGLMLKAVSSVRLGDFVDVDGSFGRVTEIGLLHTEIQTEHRDLITLANLQLATKPVRVVRSSGTVVSAQVSLGYDVPRQRIENALQKAIDDAGLVEGFVHVMQLADFSVIYKAAGFLKDVKYLISTRSLLRAAMLDRLHEDRIEIVSPTFMNQRRIDGTQFIPEKQRVVPEPKETLPEDLIFDKAEEAESIGRLEELRAETAKDIRALKEALKEAKDDEARKSAIDHRIEILDKRARHITELIDKKKAEVDGNA